MPDNWGYVLAAYALTAAVLGVYWRRLVRKENELRQHPTPGTTATTTTRATTGSARDVAGSLTTHPERARQSSTPDHTITERSRQPSSSGHPRPDPSTRGPLQQ